MENNKTKGKEFYFLTLPPLFWLLLFFAVPLIIILFYSVSFKELYGGVIPGFSFHNYKMIFDMMYMKILFRSFLYALATTVITLMLAYPTAYYMTFASNKIKLLLMFIIIVPFWTNFLIRMYSFVIILGNSGVVNTILMKTGLIKEPLNLMNNTFTVLVGLIYCNLPFMILPIYSSLDKMDTSLLEASLDLGASKFFTFIKVTFPYSISGVVAGVIFVFVPTLGNFIVPDILGGTNNMMIGNIITSQFLQLRNWPFGSALSSMLIFVVMIFISLYIRYFNPVKDRNR